MTDDTTLPGPTHQDALPPGTRLGEFELQRQLGEGGFSIVYLAWDHSLQRRVAVKEYLPASLASRVPGGSVQARSERTRDTFETGLRSFINEARALAQFDHPALVKVHRFWEAQGTAYMVMPFYEGRTLKQTVREMASPPDERWLLDLLAPVTEALAVIHAAHWYHRDIAPDNIILLSDTRQPLLLDFGAARRVIGESTQDLTAILKPGYAPLEQYAESPGLRQGAWTDVYALAATVYWMITGRTPPAAVARVIEEAYVPLAASAAGRYGDPFLRAIDHALALRPEQRTRSIDAFRREIGLQATPHRPEPEPATAAPAVRPPVVAAADLPTRVLTRGPAGGPATGAPDRTPPAPAGRRRLAGMAAALAALAVAGGVGWRASLTGAGGPSTPSPAVGEPASAVPAPSVPAPALPAPAVLAPESAPSAAAATPPPPQAAQTPAEPPAPATVASAARPAARVRPGPASAGARTPNTEAARPARDRECAALLQRLSLGEDSRETADRIAALGCR